ncbi:TD and POZ domain-containing protein 4-like [Uloborus diversus]|uniref:TD and POZ domain-containing protein 4-like n=1 Tax=Uloborus diversus TaxID=327109 RepID=UPI00240A5B14|nr:TD and POZ domain-containing protein 4-like [Uloborus diversus]
MDNSFDVQLSTGTERHMLEQKLYHASVTWKISNFNYNAQPNESIASREFRCADASWSVVVYPNGTKKSSGVVCICLHKMNAATANHLVSVKFIIPCYGGRNKTCELDKYNFKGNFGECGLLEIVSRKEIMKHNSGYIENGIFTIKCDMTVFGEKTEYQEGKILPEKKDANSSTLSQEFDALYLCDEPTTKKDDIATLSTDMEALYTNPRFSDVILKAGRHEFPAHRLVLRSRSKRFATMFENDTGDAVFDLADMEPCTLEEMLRYIYCDKVRQLSPKEALSLYVAANQYGLQGLVHNCRKIMLHEISIDNICEIANAADSHADQILLNAVKFFLNKNMKEILKTDNWMMFAQENQSLSLNLIRSAILNN